MSLRSSNVSNSFPALKVKRKLLPTVSKPCMMWRCGWLAGARWFINERTVLERVLWLHDTSAAHSSPRCILSLNTCSRVINPRHMTCPSSILAMSPMFIKHNWGTWAGASINTELNGGGAAIICSKNKRMREKQVGKEWVGKMMSRTQCYLFKEIY